MMEMQNTESIADIRCPSCRYSAQDAATLDSSTTTSSRDDRPISFVDALAALDGGDEEVGNAEGDDMVGGNDADGGDEEVVNDMDGGGGGDEDGGDEGAVAPPPKAKAKTTARVAATAPPPKSKAKAKAKAKHTALAAGKAPPPKAALAAVPGDVGEGPPNAKAKAKAKAKAQAPPAKAKSGAPVDVAEAPPAEANTEAPADDAEAPPAKAKAKAKAKAVAIADAKAPPPKAKGKAKAKAKAKPKAKPQAKPKAKAASEEPAPEAVETPESGLVLAEVRPPPALDTAQLFSEGFVSCVNCKQMANFTKCRVMCKGQGTWRCNKCNTKCSQLRRIHHEWPTADFLLLSEDSLM